RSIYFLVLIWFLFLSLRGPPSCTLFPYTTLFRSGRGSLRAASTLLALAVVYLALYFALPIASGRVYDVDVRALPYAYLMLTAAVLVATQRAGRSPPRIIWITATLLLAVNLAVMAHQLILADRH